MTVRDGLVASGIQVLEETSFKYSWGSRPETAGNLFLSPANDFIGTLFFLEGKRPDVHQSVETPAELIARAGRYFGRSIPAATTEQERR